MVIRGEPAVYHVMSPTALDGYVVGDIEKEHLLKLIKNLSAIYFSKVIGFCLMGNHFSSVGQDVSRHFTDSGIIGTKAFVSHHYLAFKHLFSSKHEKIPKTIRGLDGIYSLKRLSEL